MEVESFDMVRMHCPACLSGDIEVVDGRLEYNEVLRCLDCSGVFHRKMAIIGVDPVV